MEKVLRPERFETDPNAPNSTKCWQHWLKTFENFLESIASENLNKLKVLINFLSAEVYEFVSEANNYAEAKDILNSIYVKTPNEVFSRHKLYTHKQQVGESLEEFMQAKSVKV